VERRARARKHFNLWWPGAEGSDVSSVSGHVFSAGDHPFSALPSRESDSTVPAMSRKPRDE